MTDAQRAEIDAMSHYELARRWRFATDGDLLMQGEAGSHLKYRLFTEFGGFTPAISKSLGWGS